MRKPQLLQRFPNDRRARSRQHPRQKQRLDIRQPHRQTRQPRPIENHQRSQHRRHRHRDPDPPHPPDAQPHSQAEHQENQPQLRQNPDILRLLHQRPKAKRSDQHPRRDIPNNCRQPRPLKKPPRRPRRQGQHSQVLNKLNPARHKTGKLSRPRDKRQSPRKASPPRFPSREAPST